jgi:hypothetical protein
MLQEIQQSFLKSLSTDEPEFLTHLVELACLSKEQALNIYHQGVKRKSLNILKGIYPVCQQILGSELFDNLATDYARYSPPESADFSRFAAAFVEFIAEYCLPSEFAVVVQIARLEWEIYLLLREYNSPELDLEALAQVDATTQGELFFYLPTGALLLQSNYPLDEIMKVNQPDYQGECQIETKSEEFYFLVWRAKWGICIDRLTWEEWLVLQRIQMKLSFMEVCDYLADYHSSLDITTIFPSLVAQGWIASFEVSKS